MSTSFTLPDLGEGVHEAEILAIAVTLGQTVQEGQTILEVETDKAAVEIPSPYSGTVAEIRVNVGQTVAVGTVLMTFDTQTQKSTNQQNTELIEPHSQPTVKNYQPPVPASPSTRRLARELGVDLRAVTPTGSGGIVTKEDVARHAEKSHQLLSAPKSLPPTEIVTPSLAPIPLTGTGLPDFSKWGPIERKPLRSIRKATAIQMTTSWTQIPHVFCQDSVDITQLEAFRQKHKAELAAIGGKLTMTVFAMKAAATALKTLPAFNSSLDLSSGEIIFKNYFHLGVATDTEHGLVVPVIRDVDRKSIKELAIEIETAISRARNGILSRDEMQGGTFTITNVGSLGGHTFSAIINYPEVAILGLGQARMQPIVTTVEDQPAIVAKLIMPIMLCFDHRAVDGADAIRFLRLVMEILQDPDTLLISMI